jgi:hypothetical protein
LSGLFSDMVTSLIRAWSNRNRPTQGQIQRKRTQFIRGMSPSRQGFIS